MSALERYGAPAALVDQVRTMTADEFVFFGVPPARVDLLRSCARPSVQPDDVAIWTI